MAHARVALYTSAWIEISASVAFFISSWVALYTSAWIEMHSKEHCSGSSRSRTLHECVD